jgi:tRNA(His) 5'-end guanylyltransferase
MLAQSMFSHGTKGSELHGLDGNQMQDKMMVEKGVNWNDLESRYKRGTYVKRFVTSKPFTIEELSQLPPKHKAHSDPNLIIERSVIKEVEYPIFNKITNKVDVVFFGEEPKVNSVTTA